MKKKFKKWIEREKESLKRGTYIGFLVSFIMFSVVFFAFLSIPFINQSNLIDFAVKASFEDISEKWQDSFIIDYLGDLCSLNEDEYSRIRCVYNFLQDNSKYGYDSKIKEYSNSLIDGPQEFFNTSIVCRDASIMACAVYNQMGYLCELEVVPKHVYSIVDTGKDKYKVDLTKYVFEVTNH